MYIVTHEQPTSVPALTRCFSRPVKHVSGPWSDFVGKVIGLKITQRKKIVVLLADFQVILEAVERRVLIEIKAGFAILGALFLVQRGMRWAVRGAARFPCRDRAGGWNSTWVWSCLGVWKDPSRCDKGIFGFLPIFVTQSVLRHRFWESVLNSENLFKVCWILRICSRCVAELHLLFLSSNGSQCQFQLFKILCWLRFSALIQLTLFFLLLGSLFFYCSLPYRRFSVEL